MPRTGASASRAAASSAAGLADKCEVQVAYAIGVSRPVSVNVCTFGTGTVPDERIQAALEHGRVFDFRPGVFIRELGLTRPGGEWCYAKTSNYGHFGWPEYPWERTDKADAIRDAVQP